MMMMKRPFTSWRHALDAARRQTAGSMSVELALVMPFLAMLLFAAFDVSQGFQAKLRLESAARAGVQYASTLGATEDPDGIIQAAKDDANDPALDVDVPAYVCSCIETGSSTPCNSNCGGSVPVMLVNVTVNGEYTPLFNYGGMLPDSMPLVANVQFRVR